MASRRQAVEQGRLDQVAEAAADMDPDVLMCRDLQHAWQVVQDQTDISGGFERTLACGRCATRKQQVINSLGQYVGSPKYTPTPTITPHRPSKAWGHSPHGTGACSGWRH